MSSQSELLQSEEFLVSGFCRKIEKKLTSSYCNWIIPTNVVLLCQQFYLNINTEWIFDDNFFNKKKYILESNKLIRGIASGNTKSYIIYIKNPYIKLLQCGVFRINIKAVKSFGFRHQIGVTSVKNIDWTKKGTTWKKGPWVFDQDSCIDPLDVDGWRDGDVLSVELDCDQYQVTYYKNDKQMKIDQITPDKNYHFALSLDTYIDQKFEIM